MASQSNEIIATGHSGFSLRHTWLKKARDIGRKAFSEADATIKLGVGKNMVESIRYYANLCDAFREEEALNERDQLDIGEIFDDEEKDPYLDYEETIWLIHHKLVTNPHLLSYYSFFNHFNETIFTNETYREFFYKQLAEKNISKAIAAETIKRDIACFISNYAVKTEEKPTDSFSSLLSELNLIKVTERGVYKRIYQKASNIENAAFLYVLAQFWRKNHFEQKTLSLQAITQNPESPGKVFQMHEEEVHKKLKEITDYSKGLVTISETAGIINMNIETDLRHLTKEASEMLLKAYRK